MDPNQKSNFCLLLTFFITVSSCNLNDGRTTSPLSDEPPSSINVLREPDSIESIVFGDSNLIKNIKHALTSREETHFAVTRYKRDTIPKMLFLLQGLHSLTISLSSIKSIPREICNMRELHHLDVSANELVDLDNIFCLEKLTFLSAEMNNLTRFPFAIYQLDNLEYLNLTKNNFASGIKDSLPGNLEEFILMNDNLSEFPSGILGLRRLKVLNLSYNPLLKHIPSELTRMIQLQKLNLRATGVSAEEIEFLLQAMPECEIVY